MGRLLTAMYMDYRVSCPTTPFFPFASLQPNGQTDRSKDMPCYPVHDPRHPPAQSPQFSHLNTSL